MACFRQQNLIYSLILCLSLPFDWQEKVLPLTEAAPGVLLTATDIIIPIAKRETTEQDDLSSRVQQAVQSSFSSLNISVNPVELTTSIVKELKDGGIPECRRVCKPKGKASLAKQFLKAHSPDCSITLQSIELQSIGDGLTIYAVSGNTSCQQVTYQSECFLQQGESSQQAACSWKSQFAEIVDLSDNYFPRYILDVTCYGCQDDDIECLATTNHCYYEEKLLEFYPLKRKDGECDDNGFEMWEADTSKHLSVNGGCDCRRLSH